jgi:hypothetical protein
MITGTQNSIVTGQLEQSGTPPNAPPPPRPPLFPPRNRGGSGAGDGAGGGAGGGAAGGGAGVAELKLLNVDRIDQFFGEERNLESKVAGKSTVFVPLVFCLAILWFQSR